MPLPADFEKRLWAAADQLWTNSSLKPSQYSLPVLALIFLKYADHKFAAAEKEVSGSRRRGAASKEDYHAAGVLFVPPAARYSKLLQLPEGSDIGKALNEAMKAIESENDEVKGVLPRTYPNASSSCTSPPLEPRSARRCARGFAPPMRPR